MPPDTTVETNVFTSGLRSSLPPMRRGTLISKPQASAPRTSEGMFRSGVAFNRGIWQMRPASRPMTRACPSFGRVRMMARQYIAMMKFGFMPIDESSEPTVSLSTAPAASSTAMRMRSCVDRPALLGAAATSRLRGADASPAVAVCVATSRLICCSMFLNPLLAESPPVAYPSRGVWFAGTNFADEDHSAQSTSWPRRCAPPQ